MTLRKGFIGFGITALAVVWAVWVIHFRPKRELLAYKRQLVAEGEKLAVGEDGEDNSGDPRPADANSKSFAWDRGRDWVWPQPASPEQVRAYLDSRRAKHRNDTRRAADHARPSRATN